MTKVRFVCDFRVMMPVPRVKTWIEREREKRFRRWDAYEDIGFWRYWWLFLVAKLRELG